MKACFRMDDVGASSKYFERHGRTRLNWGGIKIPFPGNFWFFKSIPPTRRWGPYRELSAQEWEAILKILEKNKARMTVAVTASWVEENGTLTPFPEKFPAPCQVIRQGVASGLLEIANHGMTHCVVEDFKFLPRFWTDNRKYHREFWEWVPEKIQKGHIDRSQDILEKAFGVRPLTFVPPGHVYTAQTLELAYQAGLRILSCGRTPPVSSPLRFIEESRVTAFHDRELVLFGLEWLEEKLFENKNLPFCFVKELEIRN
jgi:peptidoglycan/xylan/chitin deacetylase (PgdA/CDA1 family)